MLCEGQKLKSCIESIKIGICNSSAEKDRVLTRFLAKEGFELLIESSFENIFDEGSLKRPSGEVVRALRVELHSQTQIEGKLDASDGRSLFVVFDLRSFLARNQEADVADLSKRIIINRLSRNVGLVIHYECLIRNF